MTGFDLYRADTTGFWKKFTPSYLIKLFTYKYIKPEVKAYFGITKREQCPTHSMCRGKEKGENKLLESNWNVDYGNPYPESNQVMHFEFVLPSFTEERKETIFAEFVAKEKGKQYGLIEWLNYPIRNIFGTVKHSFFTILKVCSELVANYCSLEWVKDMPNVWAELQKVDYNVTAPSDLLNVAYIGIKSGELKQ